MTSHYHRTSYLESAQFELDQLVVPQTRRSSTSTMHGAPSSLLNVADELNDIRWRNQRLPGQAPESLEQLKERLCGLILDSVED